jgi:aspartate/tyrosine/aromatic aminotransferase
VRKNYSSPPAYGGRVIATVLATRSCARNGKPNWPPCACA